MVEDCRMGELASQVVVLVTLLTFHVSHCRAGSVVMRNPLSRWGCSLPLCFATGRKNRKSLPGGCSSLVAGDERRAGGRPCSTRSEYKSEPGEISDCYQDHQRGFTDVALRNRPARVTSRIARRILKGKIHRLVSAHFIRGGGRSSPGGRRPARISAVARASAIAAWRVSSCTAESRSSASWLVA